jgi:type VI secretion system protein ImpH
VASNCAVGYFAASIRHRPVSAVQLSRVLSAYFGQPNATLGSTP